MLVFAIPRPKESEIVIVDELKENYLMVNGDTNRSTTLQRSPSARVRRREKVCYHSSDFIFLAYTI